MYYLYGGDDSKEIRQWYRRSDSDKIELTTSILKADRYTYNEAVKLIIENNDKNNESYKNELIENWLKDTCIAYLCIRIMDAVGAIGKDKLNWSDSITHHLMLTEGDMRIQDNEVVTPKQFFENQNRKRIEK